jgi:hypothetical protein
VTSLVGQLETAGLYWIPVHESAGTHLCVPLADGSQMTISRTVAGAKAPVSQPAVDGHGGWLAVWDDFNGVSVEVYRSARRSLTRAADTAALAASVLDCARGHGGAPVLTDEPRQPHTRGLAQDF